MTLTARDIAEITRLLEDSSFDELELEIDGLQDPPAAQRRSRRRCADAAQPRRRTRGGAAAARAAQ